MASAVIPDAGCLGHRERTRTQCLQQWKLALFGKSLLSMVNRVSGWTICMLEDENAAFYTCNLKLSLTLWYNLNVVYCFLLKVLSADMELWVLNPTLFPLGTLLLCKWRYIETHIWLSPGQYKYRIKSFAYHLSSPSGSCSFPSLLASKGNF